ncbi:hypothetical protein FC89_GL000479 [Liquorilactobacillus ghanensis DSM 18630]|uniref:Uncharacterized protein n=1 Tax=Liquorilactobacillus ghanensis DSM 18630 TaxID=1423750 RepID=A0A0R1VVY0_9LACO|nr:hypothetical protein [Liquorilactobacillus ghanensis]KRM07161.1 hypothetical protein FC89_GL000479 [Liquorilactobacillus ghanensis DSM 18630]
MSEKMKLDPEKFGYVVMNSCLVSDAQKKDPEKVAKEKLLQYLSGYYLATKFNSYELQRFEEMDSKRSYPTYRDVLNTINKVNWYS